MRLTFGAGAAVALAALALGACSTAASRASVHRYQLAAARAPLDLRAGVVVRIGDVEGTTAVDETPIVYQGSVYTYDSYKYHRWISPPSEMFRDYLEQMVFSSDATSAQTRIATLDARINAFQELDSGDQTFGVVDVRFCLKVSGAPRNSGCWHDRRLTPAASRSAEAAAEAISHSVEQVGANLAEELRSRLGRGRAPQRERQEESTD